MNGPSGTVTFLFTDIEGSTIRWERAPAAAREGIATHDTILRQVFEAHQGHIFKTIGDAFCVAFSRAGDAAETAIQAQFALGQADPDNQLPVRMALYSGETDERDGDYFGRPVNRAARLLGAGHGGQILVGQTTAELIRDDLPKEVLLRDLGSHRLKDLQHPERIYQLQHPALRSDFPSLRSLETRPHNLPRQLSSFVGRANETKQVKELLAGACLLTITGEGGSGKTRLALQVAAELLEDYPDGVWLVELAPILDPALIAQSIAASLGIREQPGMDLVESILGSLQTKRLLLILDNCEHLNDTGACARIVARLLTSSTGLRVLATSREALELVGETQWRIPTLFLPASQSDVTARSVGRYESVRLFVERATAVRSSFALTNSNAPSVLRICRAVDGIPLAIELAAARISAMSPMQIIERMESTGKFPLLTGGLKTAPTRQQTLRAAFDWSYDRLTESEKTLLHRLTVFSGGWSLPAAERVCSEGGLEEWQILDLLSSLAGKSMVVVDPERGGETRYRLLETIREYVHGIQADQGGIEALRDSHRDYFLEVAEEAEPHLQQDLSGALLTDVTSGQSYITTIVANQRA